MKIAIVKYGMGNVASVQKILKKLGYQSVITNSHSELKKQMLFCYPELDHSKKGWKT